MSFLKNTWVIALLGVSLAGCESYRALDQDTTWFAGHPVFADDGEAFLIAEAIADERLQIPPLQGWTARANPRFALHRQTRAGERKPFVSGVYPGYVMEAYWMRSAGYAVINRLRQPEESRSALVLSNDGTPRGTITPSRIAHPVDNFIVVPSWDGLTLAGFGYFVDYDDVQGTQRRVTMTVTFYDPGTLVQQSAYEYQDYFGDFYQPERPVFYWDRNGDFIVTDHAHIAVASRPGQGWREVQLPSCSHPRTSSSRYSPWTGEYLAVDDDQVSPSGSFFFQTPLCTF